MKGVK
jgi:hypothetical protein